MYFKHNTDDTIEINGVRFPYEVFLRLEPDYVKPSGMKWRMYEQGSYHHIHTIDASQISGEYPWEDGDRYISRLGDLKLLHTEVEETKTPPPEKEPTIAKPKKLDPAEILGEDYINKLNALWDFIANEVPKSESIYPVKKSLRKKEA